LESGDEVKIKQWLFSDSQVFPNKKLSRRSSPDFFPERASLDFFPERASPDFFHIKDFVRQDSFDTSFQVFDESFGTQNQNGMLYNFPGSNCGDTHDDYHSGNTQDLQKTILMFRNSNPEQGNHCPSKSKKLTVKGNRPNRSKYPENIGPRNHIYRMMINGQEPELIQPGLTLKKCNRPIDALTHNLVSKVAPGKKSKFHTPTDEPPPKDDIDT
jgi:hypothetical protein